MILQDNEQNFAKILASNEYQDRKERLRKQINSFPMVIDYSCFKKTELEKYQAYGAKISYRENKKRQSIALA